MRESCEGLQYWWCRKKVSSGLEHFASLAHIGITLERETKSHNKRRDRIDEHGLFKDPPPPGFCVRSLYTKSYCLKVQFLSCPDIVCGTLWQISFQSKSSK